MTTAESLARQLADVLRRLESLERETQLGASSIDIDGEPVLLADAMRAGLAAEAKAAEAIDLASSVDAKADGRVQTFYETDAPDPVEADLGVGDFWVSDDGHASQWDGAAWSPVTSEAVTEALSAARDAQSTADGKVTTFYGDIEPTAEGVGDVWYDEGHGHLAKRWNGSAWVPLPVGNGAISQSAVDTPELAPSAVTATEIAPGAVTSGSIKSDAIDGKTITGATVRTAASGRRIVLDQNGGLKSYANDGTTVVAQVMNDDPSNLPSGDFSGFRAGVGGGFRIAGATAYDATMAKTDGYALQLRGAGSVARGSGMDFYEKAATGNDVDGDAITDQARIYTGGVVTLKVLSNGNAKLRGRLSAWNIPAGGMLSGLDSVVPTAVNTVTQKWIWFTPTNDYFVGSGALPRVVVTPITTVPHSVFISVTDVTYNGFRVNLRRSDGVVDTGFHWIAVQTL